MARDTEAPCIGYRVIHAGIVVIHTVHSREMVVVPLVEEVLAALEMTIDSDVLRGPLLRLLARGGGVRITAAWTTGSKPSGDGRVQGSRKVYVVALHNGVRHLRAIVQRLVDRRASLYQGLKVCKRHSG